jgi:hypothetical protein
MLYVIVVTPIDLFSIFNLSFLCLFTLLRFS